MTPKVLILGGGIGGPALALSLKQRGIHSTIYEIRPELSTTGGSITLAANALRNLCYGAGEEFYESLKSHGYVFDRMNLYDDAGYHYGEMMVGREDFPAIRIMRTRMNEVLIDACLKQGIEVYYGKRTKEIVETEDGVELRWEDGGSVKGAPAVAELTSGDILIGADGIHSKVRSHILGDSNPDTYFSKSCVVNGFLPISSVNSLGITFPAVVLSPAGMLMTQPVNPDGQRLAWGMRATVEEDKTQAEWREFRVSGEAARQAKASYQDIHTPIIRSLIDNVKDEECQLWAPHGLPHLPRWHSKRCCLIGDAAHAFPPNGQGTAMAFEDAAYLSRLLSSEEALDKGYEAVFTKFESTRRKRVESVQKVTGQLVGAAVGQVSGLRWWLKKYGMWAYVTIWKRGKMEGEAYLDYSVADEDIIVD